MVDQIVEPAEPSGPVSNAAHAEAEVKHRSDGTGPPYAILLGLVAGYVLLDASLGPLRDVDVYWHTLIGEQLAKGPWPAQLGGWEALPQLNDWHSTQSLTELLLYALHSAGSWVAIAGYRVVTLAIAIAVLALATLRSRPLALASWPFAITVVALGDASQERAQQLTYIGAAVLSGVLVRGMRGQALPRWWLMLPATVVWANAHGGWILVPAVLMLIAIGRVLDHGVLDWQAKRAAVLSVVTILAGLVSPAGTSNLTAVWRISGAAATAIVEWQPTAPFTRGGIASGLMLVLILIAWSRPWPVPKSETLATIALVMLSWTSWRNLIPALILITPLVAEHLTQAFPSVANRRSPAWSTHAGIALAVSFGLVGLATLGRDNHLPVDEYPISLAAQVADLPPGSRVLNDYNVAGMTLFLGGDGTKVGIDGRTDYYGSEFIDRYQSMMRLGDGWEGLLADIRPSAALILDESPLAFVLLNEEGWTVDGRENGYVLMSAPHGRPR